MAPVNFSKPNFRPNHLSCSQHIHFIDCVLLVFVIHQPCLHRFLLCQPLSLTQFQMQSETSFLHKQRRGAQHFFPFSVGAHNLLCFHWVQLFTDPVVPSSCISFILPFGSLFPGPALPPLTSIPLSFLSLLFLLSAGG